MNCEKMPIVAICYDFDKTLSPIDMQAQGFIQSIGYEVNDFWTEVDSFAKDNEMDGNLAYMLFMIEKAKDKFDFTKERLMKEGAKVKLFNGVEDWFDRINEYGLIRGVQVEHYILSSGLKEMIEGTSIAKYFKKIYASSYLFDENVKAIWPAQVVNYTTKTQYLFRISKGVLDVNDNRVNDYLKDGNFRVPFTNMVYIGDSDTDIPCMRLVNSYQGYSIGVYNPKTNDKSKVNKMLDDKRIKYSVPADYSENSEIDLLVKSIIEKIKK